ncbi:hypothetical protein GW7_06461 [Heterocephalus glaber]|uniref:Uncharacterized protein n=1 Tax=Heterocephalus glaber TaxID=10181 RepID=G5BZ49_HETGA|nr:hypothetical protein GW7_06461 [Heterocephalus glaber]
MNTFPDTNACRCEFGKGRQHASDPPPGPGTLARQTLKPAHCPKKLTASASTHAAAADHQPPPRTQAPSPPIPVRPGKHKPASSALQQLAHRLRRHLRFAAKGLFPAPHFGLLSQAYDPPSRSAVKRPCGGCALQCGAGGWALPARSPAWRAESLWAEACVAGGGRGLRLGSRCVIPAVARKFLMTQLHHPVQT